MKQLKTAAALAAFLIFVGMLIHNLNGEYLEPTFLGFEKPTDYANMAKIENALWSFSFLSSGIAHIVVGFSMMILGLFLMEMFIGKSPVAAKLTFVAAMLSGLGFLLTGISDIPGTLYGQLIRGLNPEHNTEVLLMSTLFRGIANTLAIAGLGWFAGQVTWCIGNSEVFQKGSRPTEIIFRVLGYLNVIPGLLSLIVPVAGFLYLKLLPIWILWLGLRIRKLPNPS